MKKNSVLLTICLLLCTQAFAATGEKPNILFVISDDQSFPHASAYGCTWVKTPAFDKVAERGLLFMNCYTPNAKCAPSRSCIATGRNSWQLEEAANHVSFFPEKFKTYAEALTAHSNYFVGSTGKGVDPVIVKGRDLAGKPYSGATAKPPAKGISNDDYAAIFATFLQKRQKNNNQSENQNEIHHLSERPAAGTAGRAGGG